jgi:hypothetical protein
VCGHSDPGGLGSTTPSVTQRAGSRRTIDVAATRRTTKWDKAHIRYWVDSPCAWSTLPLASAATRRRLIRPWVMPTSPRSLRGLRPSSAISTSASSAVSMSIRSSHVVTSQSCADRKAKLLLHKGTQVRVRLTLFRLAPNLTDTAVRTATGAKTPQYRSLRGNFKQHPDRPIKPVQTAFFSVRRHRSIPADLASERFQNPCSVSSSLTEGTMQDQLQLRHPVKLRHGG